MIRSLPQIRTQNFKGNAVPVSAHFPTANSPNISLIIKFDPDNNYGDSLDFSNALFKDLQSKGEFQPDEPQRLVRGKSCIFDSKISSIHLHFNEKDPSKLVGLIKTDNNAIDKTLDKSQRSEKTEFETITRYKNNPDEFKNTYGVLKKILEKFYINEENLIAKNHPYKDTFVPAAIKILNYLSKF